MNRSKNPKSIAFTKEQERIFSTPIFPAQTLKIIAFAGTGKTTTLQELTRKYPHKKFLYVAFNKSVQQEAEQKFPKNVRCKTSHALAFPSFGKTYRHKLGNIRIPEVMNIMDYHDYIPAKFVLETLSKFLVSADPKILKRHIPPEAFSYYRSQKSTAFIPDLPREAEKLWHIMQDPKSQIPMLHDGYLKLYQLSRPKLPYDCILLDEAQDTNPVVAHLLFSQKGAKVLVGDSHQQIYQFRGAENMMSRIPADTTLSLTNSFRFGTPIDTLANIILKYFCKESLFLTGNGTSFLKSIPPRTPHAIICRTNAGVFDTAVECYEKNLKWGFVGGVHGYNFDLLKDTFFLSDKKTRKIRNGFLRSFHSFEQLKKFVEDTEDPEFSSRIRIVEKYTTNIPHLVNTIQNKSLPITDAHITLTTAHKSKGLEFDHVRLNDDFVDLLAPHDDTTIEEFNLLYVAITRAKKTLQINEKTKAFLTHLKQKQQQKKAKTNK